MRIVGGRNLESWGQGGESPTLQGEASREASAGISFIVGSEMWMGYAYPPVRMSQPIGRMRSGRLIAVNIANLIQLK